MVNHFTSFDDYLQASQNGGEELTFKHYKDIQVPDDTPEPIKVTIAEEKSEEKKPAKKTEPKKKAK